MSLERIRRSAGLKSSTADDPNSLFSETPRDCVTFSIVFDRTGTGHDGNFFTPDPDAIDFDDCPFRTESSGGQLVRRRHPVHLSYSRHQFVIASIHDMGTHSPQDSPFDACGPVNVEAIRSQLLNYGFYLFFFCVSFHDNDHFLLSLAKYPLKVQLSPFSADAHARFDGSHQ